MISRRCRPIKALSGLSKDELKTKLGLGDLSEGTGNRTHLVDLQAGGVRSTDLSGRAAGVNTSRFTCNYPQPLLCCLVVSFWTYFPILFFWDQDDDDDDEDDEDEDDHDDDADDDADGDGDGDGDGRHRHHHHQYQHHHHHPDWLIFFSDWYVAFLWGFNHQTGWIVG